MTSEAAKADAKPAKVEASAWSPFKFATFTVLWLAMLIGNIGTWMRDTASGWLMTELAPSALMVSLVQAAATLPVFLLSLPAGALADIVDKRRLMIGVQIWLAAVSAIMAVATHFGIMTPSLLVFATLMAGIGAALAGPVWQSVVPELVPRENLRPAIALNSLGINISRAIGPALGGAVMLGAGVAAAYAVDVLTYLATLGALLWWRRQKRSDTNEPEHFAGAMVAGLRFAFASRPLRRVLLRAFLFFIPASAYWALLPLIARQELGAGPGGYGLLMGALGGGAILGAISMPILRKKLSSEHLVIGASFLTAAATALLALPSNVPTAAAVLALAGAAWITVLTNLNATAQGVLPNWVRGRGLAIYLTVFFGAMTLGSVVWGQIADASSLDVGLLGAGLLMALLTALTFALPLPDSDLDLSPSHHWPAPAIAGSGNGISGPVMITIDYEVPLADQSAFRTAMNELAKIRRRDGAYDWGLMSDVETPAAIKEWFLVASWEEHLRQHDRVTIADKAVQDRVNAFHKGQSPPVVRHLASLG